MLPLARWLGVAHRIDQNGTDSVTVRFEEVGLRRCEIEGSEKFDVPWDIVQKSTPQASLGQWMTQWWVYHSEECWFLTAIGEKEHEEVVAVVSDVSDAED